MAQIRVANYVSGSSGFKINGAGDAEFNDVTVRGALITGPGSSIDGVYLGSGTVIAAKLSVSQLSAISADLGAVTAGQISVAGGLVKLGEDVYGSADGIYVGSGGTIIVEDSSGSVIFDTNSVFQGARVIDAGHINDPASTGTWVWNDQAGTVPTGKKWVLITAIEEVYFSNMNIGTLDHFYFVQGGYFVGDGTTYEELPAGSYTDIDIRVSHNVYLRRDDGTGFNAYPDARWAIFEVPA